MTRWSILLVINNNNNNNNNNNKSPISPFEELGTREVSANLSVAQPL